MWIHLSNRDANNGFVLCQFIPYILYLEAIYFPPHLIHVVTCLFPSGLSCVTEKREKREKSMKSLPKKQTNVFLPASSYSSCLNITVQGEHYSLHITRQNVPLNVFQRINKERDCIWWCTEERKVRFRIYCDLSKCVRVCMYECFVCENEWEMVKESRFGVLLISNVNIDHHHQQHH